MGDRGRGLYIKVGEFGKEVEKVRSCVGRKGGGTLCISYTYSNLNISYIPNPIICCIRFFKLTIS